jgi:hypothetical protein
LIDFENPCEAARALNIARLLIIVALSCLATGAHAGDFEGDELMTLPSHDLPLEVHVSLAILNVTDVNEREEMVEFDGSVTLFWNDPRQAYDLSELGLTEEDFPPGVYDRMPPRIYQGAFAVQEVFHGWRPHVRFTNGVGDRERDYMAVGVWPDGRMAYTEYFHARLETPMDLRRFPFDRQSLSVYLHTAVYRDNEIVLVPSGQLAGLWNEDSGIADWEKGSVQVEPGTVLWTGADGRSFSISQVHTTINLARRPGHVIVSIILPLVILVCLTWCVFWMDEESVSNRVNVSFIGILTAVAYYFVVLDSVPEIPYVTLMDAFILATFLILAASLMINFVVDNLNKKGRKHAGDRVDYVCRWLFPISYFSVMALLAVIFLILG